MFLQAVLSLLMVIFGNEFDLNDYPEREYTQVSGNVRLPEMVDDIV